MPEVHISNIQACDEYHRQSKISFVATGSADLGLRLDAATPASLRRSEIISKTYQIYVMKERNLWCEYHFTIPLQWSEHMTDIIQDPEQAEQELAAKKAAARRSFLKKNLKVLFAMAAIPAVQIMTPKSASAHDRHWHGGHRGGHHGGHGGHRGRGHGGHHGGGVCFLRGTRISTVTGERRVEDLAVGDMVPTVFGGPRPIQWIGRFRRIRGDGKRPWAKIARPVRIARSALAPNVPSADLYVTQGHALLLDGLLVPAGSLVNGTTISLYAAEEYDELEFFHIKLETHDAIYAEGAPCETLLRVDETMSNFADYVRKYGAAEAPDRHCAPIVCNGLRSELMIMVRRRVSPWRGPQKFDTIRARLEQRAMTLM